jgi:predicted O-methyltransferase YrrM
MDFSDVEIEYKKKIENLTVVSVVSDTVEYLIRQRNNFMDSYDFIYVDGDHSEDAVWLDAIYSFKILRKNGIIV